MSTVAREAFDREPYRAPTANLRHEVEASDDTWFSAEGRIGVFRYNARAFLCMLVMGVAAGAMSAGAASGSSALMTVSMIIGLPLVLVAAVAIIFCAIKRLHDLGFVGWFCLIGIIPIVGTFWVLFYSLVPGKEDDNNYGTRREASGMDKILGSLGIALTVIMLIVPFLIS